MNNAGAIPSATEKLLRALGAAASYNDKGFYWMGHSAEQQSTVLSGLHAEISELAEQIGHEVLGPELSRAIASGAVVHDASGEFVLLARCRFGVKNGE